MMQRRPSVEAEEQWRIEEIRYRRRFVVVALSSATMLVLTWISASLGLRDLAVASTLVLFGIIGWIVFLIVARRRAFLEIMTNDGLSRKEAAREDYRRHNN